MAYSLYLIRNTRDTDLYYAEHGEIGGVRMPLAMTSRFTP